MLYADVTGPAGIVGYQAFITFGLAVTSQVAQKTLTRLPPMYYGIK